MKRHNNFLLILLILGLFFELSIESHSFIMHGDQQDLPYSVNFQIQAETTIKFKTFCQNESNLSWLLLRKQAKNKGNLYATSSDQKYSANQSQINFSILKGNYTIVLRAYSKSCLNWTLEINSLGLNQSIYKCKFFDSASGICHQCESKTPYLVKTAYIPQMTCARKLIQGCQKYNIYRDNCQTCSKEIPYLVNFEMQNLNLQKRCVSQLIQMCRIYRENGTQCARYSYENVRSNSPDSQSQNIMLSSTQDFAILESSQCTDPTLSDYQDVFVIAAGGYSYKCIAKITKYIALRLWSGGFLDSFWYGGFPDTILFVGIYSLNTNNTQVVQSQVFYQLYPYGGWWQNQPIPDTMFLIGSNDLNLFIPNCKTYNSQNDHCLQCDPSYPYLVATDYMPFEACVNTKITGCYIYSQLYAQSCRLSCNYGDSNIVDTNVRPIKTCAPSLITNCEVYTLNGTYCICYAGQTVKAHMFIDPYSFYCVYSLIDKCILYGLYGTSCLLCTSQTYLVPTQDNINICIKQLIIGCLVYTYDGLSCYTCCSGCSLVTTNYSPYLACLPQNILIPQCEKYDLNNHCLLYPVKLRKFTCFGSLKCKVETNKLNQCYIGSA